MNRLVQLLSACVAIIQDNVTVDAHDAEDPLNAYLESVDATPIECAWLGPRLSAYAAGFSHGHVAGQVHRDGCLWQHPKEHLEDRRN